MTYISSKDFSKGWIPSDDAANASKNGLLRMDNLVLDEVGILSLRKGIALINTLTDDSGGGGDVEPPVVDTSNVIGYWKFNSADNASSWIDEQGNFNLTGTKYSGLDEEPWEQFETVGITAIAGKVQGNAAKIEGDFNDWKESLISTPIVCDFTNIETYYPAPITRKSDLSNGFTVHGWFLPHKDNTGGTGLYFAESLFQFITDEHLQAIMVSFNKDALEKYGLTLKMNDEIGPTTGENVVSEDAWHFIVVWYDPISGLAYIQLDNGTPVSKSMSDLGTWTKEAICFGDPIYEIAGTPTFHFDFDEWAFRNRVLTDAERTDLWNDGNGKEVII
jgi:hypothetical protein